LRTFVPYPYPGIPPRLKWKVPSLTFFRRDVPTFFVNKLFFSRWESLVFPCACGSKDSQPSEMLVHYLASPALVFAHRRLVELTGLDFCSALFPFSPFFYSLFFSALMSTSRMLISPPPPPFFFTDHRHFLEVTRVKRFYGTRFSSRTFFPTHGLLVTLLMRSPSFLRLSA